MRLGIGASLLVSAHGSFRRFAPGAGEACYRWRQTSLVSARGGVGMYPGTLREKIGTNEGGLLSALPFSLCVYGDPDLAPQRQAA